jgi:hypothetical protein
LGFQLIRQKNKRSPLIAGVRVFVAALALGSVFVTPVSANECAKWFVVRHHTTGACWRAMLIQVDGEYVHGIAQMAGGPYGTKKEAMTREEALEKEGVCTQ